MASSTAMDENKFKHDKKLKGVVVERSVVYGSEAHWLGRRAGEGASTHKWRVYVRGPNPQDDISYFIKKVVFHLHTSFTNPKRVIEEPPFEIEEEGWGEFELAITLYFTDPTEKAVDLYHTLKLYPSDNQPLKKGVPIISEKLSDIVFQDPTETFHKILEAHPQSATVQVQTEQRDEEQDRLELEKIRDASKVVKSEIVKLLEQYDEAVREIGVIKKEVSKKKTT